jgi:hypothetical protein
MEVRTRTWLTPGLLGSMTPALMREFKDRITVERLSLYDKRLLWCVAVFAFWGSLRVHEILSVKPDEFTLLLEKGRWRWRM